MDNNNFFEQWFGKNMNTSHHKNQPQTDKDKEQILNDLWFEYDDYLQELKNNGYKVLRNSEGFHKIIKNNT